jgi:hypothetical protein
MRVEFGLAHYLLLLVSSNGTVYGVQSSPNASAVQICDKPKCDGLTVKDLIGKPECSRLSYQLRIGDKMISQEADMPMRNTPETPFGLGRRKCKFQKTHIYGLGQESRRARLDSLSSRMNYDFFASIATLTNAGGRTSG